MGALTNLNVALAQSINDALTRSRSTRTSTDVRHRLLRILRRGLLQLSDPQVRYRWGEQELMLPLSHELPHFRAAHPQYSENIGRIAKLVHGFYPDLTIIDIGANIGDTAACIRNHIRAPILCIEGNPAFLPTLRRNLETLGGDLEVAPHFIGPPGTGNIETSNGSARIVPASGSALDMRSLSSILEEHPRFASAKLVKIDTDGFDCKIIRSEIGVLESLRAVVFFEYDPRLTKLALDSVDGIFELFAASGFSRALVYDNIGNFLLALDTSNEDAFADLSSYFMRNTDQPYGDICVFHERDADLFAHVRHAERRLDV